MGGAQHEAARLVLQAARAFSESARLEQSNHALRVVEFDIDVLEEIIAEDEVDVGVDGPADLLVEDPARLLVRGGIVGAVTGGARPAERRAARRTPRPLRRAAPASCARSGTSGRSS